MPSEHRDTEKVDKDLKMSTERALNAVMEFETVVEVSPDGTVTPRHDLYGPEVIEEGEALSQLPGEGWTLLTGFTGQYGYNGPVMHSSEFIGGGLERHIRETPGYYVALVAETDCLDGPEDERGQHCTLEAGCDCEPAGWVIAFKPLEGA